MTWIKTIDEDEATGTVKEFYDHWQGIESTPTNIVKAHSLKPEIMTQWLALAGTVAFGGSSLGRRREELIAVLVPALLKCKYCTVAHARISPRPRGRAPARRSPSKRTTVPPVWAPRTWRCWSTPRK